MMVEDLRSELEKRVPDEEVPQLSANTVRKRGRQIMWRRRAAFAGAGVALSGVLIAGFAIMDFTKDGKVAPASESTEMNPGSVEGIDCDSGDAVSVSDYAPVFEATSDIVRVGETSSRVGLAVYQDNRAVAFAAADKNQSGEWGLSGGAEACGSLLSGED
jgi:hypothetical protein